MHSSPFEKMDGNGIETMYGEMKGAKTVNKGMVVQVDFPNAKKSPPVDENNYFVSPYSANELGGPNTYVASQFHFHA